MQKLTRIFEEHEAEVRSYCRSFPAVFESAVGATLRDTEGATYVDFLAGAGTLNYGHNHPAIKRAVVNYLLGDGVIHALDMYTAAKAHFIETLHDVILAPRELDYKVTFPAPTGTNAVETALKIARRATGRENVISFTNGFHGMTLGALAASGNLKKRAGAGVPLTGVTRMPYDGYLEGLDSAAYLERILDDAGGGVDAPAAILVETIQAEGGLNTATSRWLQAIAAIAAKHGALLIVDDIQTGCGRTNTFFSFEDQGITPDIVCLSKAIGGIGLPMSLVLFRPEFDVLQPGEHNGTFRGHNLAFVAATAALDLWREPAFAESITQTSREIRSRLESFIARYPMADAQIRGRGMLLGLAWSDPTIASRVSQLAFQNGVIAETTGAEDQVLKFLPPLTISAEECARGLDGIERAIAAVHAARPAPSALVAAE